MLAACVAPPPGVVDVTVGAPAGRVSDRFLSVAVDSALLSGGDFFGGAQRADFSSPKLVNLTAALAPGYLRLGGTAADSLRYDDPSAGQWNVTPERWAEATAFTQRAGLSLFFTLNEQQPELALVGTADVALWELGNEINGWPFVHGFNHALSGAQYADDLRKAKAQFPGRMAGPASAFWPVVGEMHPVLPDFLRAGAGGADVITWHYYPQQSERCPLHTRLAEPRTLLDPRALDDVDSWADEVERLRDRDAPNAEVWLGETGHAQCGGQPQVSGTWVSALWWADLLGKMARRGTPVVVRQSLVGGDYGLLDAATLEPRPDYWVSVLWKRLVGPQALAVHSSDPQVRAYAACGVVVLINLDDAQGRTVNLTGLQYRLESDALTSTRTLLNGNLLTAGDDGTLPALEPKPVDAATLAPAGVTFVVLPGGSTCCPSC
jgi:heparanase 1